MGLRAAGPKPGTLVPFIPTARGNDKLDYPAVMQMKAPSADDKRRYLATITKALSFKPQKGEKVSIELGDIQEQKRQAVLFVVERVDHYVDQDDTPILTAQDLWDRGDVSVAEEVAEYAQQLLGTSEEDAKNSGASSFSSHQTTPASSGTAATVEPEASALAATVTLPGVTPTFDTRS